MNKHIQTYEQQAAFSSYALILVARYCAILCASSWHLPETME